MDIKKLMMSFRYAFLGLWHVVKTEQNMRIHISIANLIIAFAYYFGIEKIEWTALFIVIGFVIFAELLNTALEYAMDLVTKEYNINIKYAKDAAAGAVTVAAVTSVITGIVLFGDLKRIAETITYIFTNATAILIFLCLFIVDICVIMFLKER